MVFCFVQNFFFGQHKSQNIFFLSREAGFFFPEFIIRLYDKNSESDYFVFSSTKSRIFFSATLGIRIFFQKKTITPPFKLNGRSLSGAFYYRLDACTGLCKLLFETQFLSNYPTIIIFYLYNNILQVNNKCIISCNYLTKLLK